jgi:hypothetical protein
MLLLKQIASQRSIAQVCRLREFASLCSHLIQELDLYSFDDMIAHVLHLIINDFCAYGEILRR